MARFKFPKYADTLREENEEFEKRFAGREEEIKSQTALIVNGDLEAAGHNQLVVTEKAKNWLTKLREEHHNPMLGKDYMMRAPEFERDSEDVTDSEYMSDAEADKILTVQDEKNENVRHIDDDFNPNITEVELSHDEVSRRFVEACIIDNTTQKCIDWKFEDILSECAAELEKEFGKEDYKIPDDFDQLVEASLEKAEKMQLIGMETVPKIAIPHLKEEKK